MNIAIIGGGFTGLTAAYALAKKGHKITLFEKEKYLGGLAHGFKPASPSQGGRPGWDWHLESAYHHLFTNDKAILSLIKELGLVDKLIINRPVTATLYQNTMYPLDSPIHLLRFPGLPIIDRFRTGVLLAFLKLNLFWKPFEWLTAKNLFITLGGRRTWETIWEPLMIGKFGNYADRVAASWLWARIKKRTQKLYYMKGGFHTLIVALTTAIKQRGGTIRSGVTVNEIKKQNWKLEIGNWKFDKVLLTIPTPIAAKLLPQLLTSNYLLPALSVPHLHAQTLILETRNPILKNTYWLNITDRTFPFLAVVAHTNMIDKKYYGGHHITYFGNYLSDGHRYLSMTADQLYNEFLPFIHRLSMTANGKMKTTNFSQKRLPFAVYRLHSFVAPFAQPVHELHYSTRAPKLKTSLPGLYLANMDSIYPWDRGTNYAVELGQRAAAAIV